MIDIKLIRANPDIFINAAKVKNVSVDINRLLEIDKQLLHLRQELQEIRTEQNKASKEIPHLDGQEKQRKIQQLTTLKRRAKEISSQIDQLAPEFNRLMLLVPQVPDPSVPIGADENDNVEIKKVGKIRKFDFDPLDHVELGKALDIIDIDRGVKLAGTRNYCLKGLGVLLHQAVLKLATDIIRRKGFTLLTVPVLVRDKVMYGTGYFPVGMDQAYLIERDGLSLAGTAEVPLTAYHADEILDEEDLPKKYAALSPCYRREAGAAGKDTQGLYRIHYFDKVEQVIIGPNDVDKSIKFHHEILANAEEVLQTLELPYRVVNVCTGDLGQGQVQKFDIETWMPSRNAYGETHSASRFHDFQARRLNIRYRSSDGKLRFCHTLNNTVIASPRILIPILELYQNRDGSVTIPRALREYMDGIEVIKPI